MFFRPIYDLGTSRGKNNSFLILVLPEVISRFGERGMLLLAVLLVGAY
jgi:hypothetical protein